MKKVFLIMLVTFFTSSFTIAQTDNNIKAEGPGGGHYMTIPGKKIEGQDDNHVTIITCVGNTGICIKLWVPDGTEGLRKSGNVIVNLGNRVIKAKSIAKIKQEKNYSTYMIRK